MGVAKTNAHGQKTTNMVTLLVISNVNKYVNIAAVKAITTIIVAHLSATLTIFAFSGEDVLTNLINF